jgi:hypothetical protein
MPFLTHTWEACEEGINEALCHLHGHALASQLLSKAVRTEAVHDAICVTNSTTARTSGEAAVST